MLLLFRNLDYIQRENLYVSLAKIRIDAAEINEIINRTRRTL